MPAKHQTNAAIVGLVAAVMVSFSPAFGASWLSWDDQSNFIVNENWRGLGWAQLEWMWTTRMMGHFQPLSWMSFGLGYTLHGLDPGPYHLENVGLHVVSSVLVFFLSRSLFPAMGVLGALAGALFFAIHPQRVESVAWISERRDVLAMPFALGAVLAWLVWVRERRARWLVAAACLHLLSMTAKAHAVTLPAVLLLLDIWPLARTGALRSIILEKLPFIGISVVFSLLAVDAQRDMLSAVPAGDMPAMMRISSALYGMISYPGKLLVPANLTPLYPLSEANDVPLGLAAASLAGITVLAAALVGRVPGLLAAWLLYLGILLPVSGLFHSGPQAIADRYTYFAGIPFAVLFGGAAAWAVRRHRLLLVAVGSYVLALGIGTYQYTAVWRSSLSLWRHAAQIDPGDPRIRFGLAGAYLAAGQTEVAIALYAGLREAESGRKLDMAYATALSMGGREGEAIEVLLNVQVGDPAYASARCFAGTLLAKRGQTAPAVAALETGIAAGCKNADARATLATLHGEQPRAEMGEQP